MKKILAIILSALLVLSMAACQAPVTEDDGKYVIGICQLVPHPALDEATKGFIAAVEEGLGKENVEFKTEVGDGEAASCSPLVNTLVSAKVDLIMANATPALAAAYNATETIPILGTSVTEYGVALGIKNFTGTVGGNVSGTSDLADLSKQAQMILDWVPNAKQVGLLFCSSEPNSKYQVDEIQKILEGKNLTCKQFGFADASDMNAVTQAAADWSDVIYVPTDNTVAKYATTIDGICRPAKVPIVAGEQGICSGCGIATMSISYYDLGYATGKMAVKILKGEAKISEMPIEYAPNVTYLYNADICADLGITPLEGYAPIAK